MRLPIFLRSLTTAVEARTINSRSALDDIAQKSIIQDSVAQSSTAQHATEHNQPQRSKKIHAYIGSAPIKIPEGLTWSIHDLGWKPKVLETNTRLWSYRKPVRTPPGSREYAMSDDISVTSDADWVPEVPETGLPHALKHARLLRLMGPKGATQLPILPFVSLTHQEGLGDRGYFEVSVLDPAQKEQRAMWGTTRTLLSNAIDGVMDGYTLPVRLVGVGYRATLEEMPQVEGQAKRMKIALKLGFSHPVEEAVPLGVEVTIPQPTRIVLRGVDKAVLGRVAARIRRHRPPEPYNGKGVFVGEETIKRKEAKKK